MAIMLSAGMGRFQIRNASHRPAQTIWGTIGRGTQPPDLDVLEKVQDVGGVFLWLLIGRPMTAVIQQHHTRVLNVV